MISMTENLLLEKLQKLDRDIQEAETALIHLNKQAGAKISKIADLKNERRSISAALNEIREEA